MFPKPMLAHEYLKRGKSIRFPAWVQPKLDGIRVIAHREADKVTYWSRLGNKFTTLEHLTPFIMEKFPTGALLDGEAYIHGTPFQHITSLVKRDHPTSNSKLVKFWVYDLITPVTFEARNALLRACAKSNPKDSPIVFLPAVEVSDEAGIKKAHAMFILEGFEGTMIRNGHGMYAHKRSVDLQKYKDFMDAEFEIIGTEQCTGKDAGMIKFICLEPTEGVEFKVEPAGDDETRRAMWLEREKYHGKTCTVKFFGYHVDGRPRFPTAAVVRDYE